MIKLGVIDSTFDLVILEGLDSITDAFIKLNTIMNITTANLNIFENVLQTFKMLDDLKDISHTIFMITQLSLLVRFVISSASRFFVVRIFYRKLEFQTCC